MFLAGDIGGTKSRLAIFAEGMGIRAPLKEEVLPSGRFSGIEALIGEFLKRSGLSADRACLAVAGPVIDGRAAVTNLPWIADADAIRRTFGFRSVRLLNDVAATARAVPLLESIELHTLTPGEPAAGGAIAVIALGTGLGEAFLTWDGVRYREYASEGGHADFAPGNLLEMDLLRELWRGADQVSYEAVCSGPGLGRIYRFLRERGEAKEPPWLAVRLAEAADPAPIIVEAALTEKDDLSIRAVRLFVSILGAEAGNLALKTLAAGGVYLGGGIAPRIIPFLEERIFLTAFRRKGRMADLLSRIPVHVIIEPRAALIGAADLGLADA
ncbi:MAG: glucokinase [Deltaproteobacteria bacterium]|nr:glucokinase [Deltaproteobacteria bacterium]